MAAAGDVNSRIRQAKSAFRVTHQISRHLLSSNLRGNTLVIFHCSGDAEFRAYTAAAFA